MKLKLKLKLEAPWLTLLENAPGLMSKADATGESVRLGHFWTRTLQMRHGTKVDGEKL